jgi:Caspase domain
MKTTKPLTLGVSAAVTLICSAATSQESKPTPISLDAERFQAVVCLLPPRQRRLGGLLTYVERRRVVETTATDCEINGGEYTVYDRANDETALAFWKQEAVEAATDEERAKAQTYVGEIYEKRLGVPDYGEAARWYKQGVDSGSSRAKLHLAYLYERGLGVERDLDQALNLWRDGMGIEEGLVLESELTAVRTESQRKIDDLTAELARQNQTTQQLQQLLADNVALAESQRSTLQATKRDLESLGRQLEEERAKPKGSVAELAALQRQVDEKTGTISEQQARVALLEAQMVAQRAQLDASASAAAIHDQQLRQALDTVAKQEIETADLREALVRRDAQISGLERQITTASAGLKQQQRREAELAAELARLTGAGTSDSAARAEAAARMSVLQTQLDAAKREIAAREGDLARMQQSLVAERAIFDRTLQSAAAERANLERDLETARAERAQLEGQSDQKDAEVAALRSRLGGMNEQLGAQEAEVERLKRQLETTPTAPSNTVPVAEVQRQLDQKQQEIAKQTASIESIRKEWLTAKAEADSLRQQLAAKNGDEAARELRAQMASLERQIVTITTQREELRQTLSRATLEKDQLREEIASTKRRLELERQGLEQDRVAMSAGTQRLNEELVAKDRAILAKEQAIMELQAQIREQDLEEDGLLSERRQYMTSLTRSFSPGNLNLQIPDDVDLDRYKYRALIIGNWDYTYINDLETVEEDVRTVKTLLEQRYGFAVDLLTNLTRDQMYRELNKLSEYGKDELVLIYYAGHGTLDEFKNGYWQPVDYEPAKDPSATAVSVEQITQHLNMMQAKHVMVIADSCYSGALLRDNSVEITNVEQRLKYWINNASRTVLTSGGLAPVLDSGNGEHSVFANAFIDVLADNTTILSGEALHSRVRESIEQDSQQLSLEQTPLFAGLADAGHANGQFVFVPRATEP